MNQYNYSKVNLRCSFKCIISMNQYNESHFKMYRLYNIQAGGLALLAPLLHVIQISSIT